MSKKQKKICQLCFCMTYVFYICFSMPLEIEISFGGCIFLIQMIVILFCYWILCPETKTINFNMCLIFFNMLGLLCRYFIENGSEFIQRNYTLSFLGAYLIVYPILLSILFWMVKSYCEHYNIKRL